MVQSIYNIPFDTHLRNWNGSPLSHTQYMNRRMTRAIVELSSADGGIGKVARFKPNPCGTTTIQQILLHSIIFDAMHSLCVIDSNFWNMRQYLKRCCSIEQKIVVKLLMIEMVIKQIV